MPFANLACEIGSALGQVVSSLRCSINGLAVNFRQTERHRYKDARRYRRQRWKLSPNGSYAKPFEHWTPPIVGYRHISMCLVPAFSGAD
jgi:hypothetical protein